MRLLYYYIYFNLTIEIILYLSWNSDLERKIIAIVIVLLWDYYICFNLTIEEINTLGEKNNNNSNSIIIDDYNPTSSPTPIPKQTTTEISIPPSKSILSFLIRDFLFSFFLF
jgi:hypothetical protein